MRGIQSPCMFWTLPPSSLLLLSPTPDLTEPTRLPSPPPLFQSHSPLHSLLPVFSGGFSSSNTPNSHQPQCLCTCSLWAQSAPTRTFPFHTSFSSFSEYVKPVLSAPLSGAPFVVCAAVIFLCHLLCCCLPTVCSLL